MRLGVGGQVGVNGPGGALAGAGGQDHGGGAGHGVPPGIDPMHAGLDLPLVDQQPAPGMGL